MGRTTANGRLRTRSPRRETLPFWREAESGVMGFMHKSHKTAVVDKFTLNSGAENMAYNLDEDGLSISDNKRGYRLISKGGGSDGRLGFELLTKSGLIEFSVYRITKTENSDEIFNFSVTNFNDYRNKRNKIPAYKLIEESIRSFVIKTLNKSHEVNVKFNKNGVLKFGDRP